MVLLYYYSMYMLWHYCRLLNHEPCLMLTAIPRVSGFDMHSNVIHVIVIVPEKCPRSDPIEECPTCCCESGDNVEFYDPGAEEPNCTALPATYEMKFNFAWSEVCHPGDYLSYSIFNPVWSAPIGVSHNIKYRLWDACMDDVSVGVGLVSQIGLTGVLVQEFTMAGSNILDYTVDSMFVQPSGQSSQNLRVDKDHQWVSAISNRGPTPDQLVGVADLHLCDGDKWRESVKVCFELFSTAAASERVAGEMERNSVQGDSCSFGYVEFDLIEVYIRVYYVR